MKTHQLHRATARNVALSSAATLTVALAIAACDHRSDHVVARLPNGQTISAPSDPKALIPRERALTQFVDLQLKEYAHEHGVTVSSSEVADEIAKRLNSYSEKGFNEEREKRERILTGLDIALKDPAKGEEYYERELSPTLKRPEWESWKKQLPDIKSIEANRPSTHPLTFEQFKAQIASQLQSELLLRKAREAIAGHPGPEHPLVKWLVHLNPPSTDARTAELRLAEAIEQVATAHTWVWISKRIEAGEVSIVEAEFQAEVKRRITSARNFLNYPL